MAVIDKHRIIHERWTFGVCENCGYNPERVQMEKEFIVSGDPKRSKRSEENSGHAPSAATAESSDRSAAATEKNLHLLCELDLGSRA